MAGPYPGGDDRHPRPHRHPADGVLFPGHRPRGDHGGGCDGPPGGGAGGGPGAAGDGRHPGPGGPGGGLHPGAEAGRGGGRYPGQEKLRHQDYRRAGGHRCGPRVHCRGGLPRGGGDHAGPLPGPGDP